MKIHVFELEARHDFNDVVSRRAFDSIDAGRRWSDKRCQELKEEAFEKDPSFDDYCFEPRIHTMDLETQGGV